LLPMHKFVAKAWAASYTLTAASLTTQGYSVLPV
jgi:hypothetical protein